MSEKRWVFSESTLLPVSMLSVVVAGAVWATTIWRQGEANAQNLDSFKQETIRKDDRIYKELEKINEKLDALVARRLK